MSMRLWLGGLFCGALVGCSVWLLVTNATCCLLCCLNPALLCSLQWCLSEASQGLLLAVLVKTEMRASDLILMGGKGEATRLGVKSVFSTKILAVL